MSQQFKDCGLLATTKPLLPGTYTFIVQKNSPFKRIFNHYLGELKEKGLFNKIAVSIVFSLNPYLKQV